MPGPIKVTLHRESDPHRGHVDLTGPAGESVNHSFELPWLDDTEWQAVFLSLEMQDGASNTWTLGDVHKKAQELDLLLGEQDRLSDDRFKIIGQKLYNTVFGSEEIRRLLDRLLHAESEIPVIEFHIPDEGSLLQAYPWELLHNSERYLFDGYHAFPVRHVDFETPITQVNLKGILSVLYLAPRPDMSSHKGYESFPVLEKSYLKDLNLRHPDRLVLGYPTANPIDALQKYLIEPETLVQVVHFDTHGGFGWLCQCKQLNSPNTKQCSRSHCNKPRSSDQRDQGYLAFENANGDVDWISGDDLGKRLDGKGVQVVVLSACQSGLVGGNSTFNSVAGALVKQCIPAVVAMQFSVEVEQAKKFVEFFYEVLANRKPLTEAMAEARISMSTSWYRPALYLRTDPNNYRGTIFQAAPKEEVSLRELAVEWKRIHHECQELLDELNIPLKDLQEYSHATDLQEYSRAGEVSRLHTASAAWASRCIPLLNGIPDRWELKHVRIPELGSLREQVARMENLHVQMVQIERKDSKFWVMYHQVETLYGTLWRLLSTADGRISRLLEDM